MSRIIDCVFVPIEPYTELGRRNRSASECFEFCREVRDFAYYLALRGFRDEEMPKPLIHVSRVTRLVDSTTVFDDIFQFFDSINWSQEFVEETIAALRVMGADAHAIFLSTLHSYVESIRSTTAALNNNEFYEVIARATEDHISADLLQQRYGSFWVDGDQDWERRWYSICLHAVTYIDGWTILKRVPRDTYYADISSYFASKPEIVQRLRELENARPWEQRYIEGAMRRLGHKRLQYTIFGKKTDKLWSWIFQTEQVYAFAVFDQGEMVIYHRDTDQVLAREPIPELLSGASRSEPEMTPRELPPNTHVKVPGHGLTHRLDDPMG
jgi:hypothetical protein